MITLTMDINTVKIKKDGKCCVTLKIESWVRFKTALEAVGVPLVNYLRAATMNVSKKAEFEIIGQEEAILGGFIWSDTEEGAGYWIDVDRKIMSYFEHTKLATPKVELVNCESSMGVHNESLPPIDPDPNHDMKSKDFRSPSRVEQEYSQKKDRPTEKATPALDYVAGLFVVAPMNNLLGTKQWK